MHRCQQLLANHQMVNVSGGCLALGVAWKFSFLNLLYKKTSLVACHFYWSLSSAKLVWVHAPAHLVSVISHNEFSTLQHTSVKCETCQVQICLWCSQACKGGAGMDIAFKESQFLWRKDTNVKISDQNGLRKVLNSTVASRITWDLVIDNRMGKIHVLIQLEPLE